jgi:hypothetical protein
MGQNGIDGTGFGLKILLITANEWRSGIINGTIPNDHEQYLPFMYHSYFILKI